jgi:hypothetical protein
MADVLKVKPPSKSPKKATAKKRSLVAEIAQRTFLPARKMLEVGSRLTLPSSLVKPDGVLAFWAGSTRLIAFDSLFCRHRLAFAIQCGSHGTAIVKPTIVYVKGIIQQETIDYCSRSTGGVPTIT